MRTSVDVHNFLLERDVPHELVPVGGRLRSPARMAAALGLPTEQVGRVTLFQARDRLVAVVVPARAEPDPEAAARSIRRRSLSPVASDRATEITDFLPQAMPPAGLPDGTALILDEGLSQQEVLYFPGGETSTMLKIRPADLIRATDAVVAAVTR